MELLDYTMKEYGCKTGFVDINLINKSLLAPVDE